DTRTLLWLNPNIQSFSIAPDTNITDVLFTRGYALAIRPNNGGVFGLSTGSDTDVAGAVQDVFAGIGGTSVVVYADGTIKLHNTSLFPNDFMIALPGGVLAV